MNGTSPNSTWMKSLIFLIVAAGVLGGLIYWRWHTPTSGGIKNDNRPSTDGGHGFLSPSNKNDDPTPLGGGGGGEAGEKSTEPGDTNNGDGKGGGTEGAIDESGPGRGRRIWATARRIEDRVSVLSSGRVMNLTLDQPEAKLKNKDKITTYESGEAILSILDCSNIYLFTDTALRKSFDSKHQPSRDVIPSFQSGSIRYKTEQIRCSKKVSIETDSALINLEGTYVNLYYDPKKQITLVQLREGLVKVLPVIEQGDSFHPAKLGQPIELKKKECVITQPGDLSTLPSIAGVPQRVVLPCAAFPRVIKEIGQGKNAEKAVQQALKENMPVEVSELYPVIQVSDLIQFDDQLVGQKQGQDLLIKNVGLPKLEIKSYTIEGDAKSDFSLDQSCLQRAIDQDCKDKISFTPTAAGDRKAVLTVSYNGKVTTTQIFLVGKAHQSQEKTTGDGTKTNTDPVINTNPSSLTPGKQPPAANPSYIALSLTPDHIEFNKQKLGAKEKQTLVIKNFSQSPRAITSVSVEGGDKDSYRVETGCVKTLAPSESCNVDVYFTPQAEKELFASLMVKVDFSDQRGASGLMLNPIKLIGTGAKPVISIDQAELCFITSKVVKKGGKEVRDQHTVTLTNQGAVPLSIRNVEITGTDFSIVSDSCSGKEVIGACNITVGFSPKESKLREGSLTISHDGRPAAPTHIPLKGVGKHRNFLVRFYQFLFSRTDDPCAPGKAAKKR